jgi:RNA polymerase sigma-70 factor (ECF subfamily)
MDERQAIARLKRGDLGGLEALVRCYQVQAVHAAYLIVRDRSLAEDIVQTAFLTAAEKIGGFDSRRPFGPWFLRSVVNAAIKAASRQKRLVSLDTETGKEDASKEAFSPADWLAGSLPGPEEQAVTNDTRRAVWRALERLSPEHRAAVILRYFLDLSEAEMVVELDRPLTTVKWWLHAARQQLKALLHPQQAAAGPKPSRPPRRAAAESSEQERLS